MIKSKCTICKTDILIPNPQTKYCKVCKLEMIITNNRKSKIKHKPSPIIISCDICKNDFIKCNGKTSCSDKCRKRKWSIIHNYSRSVKCLDRRTKELERQRIKYSHIL